MPNTLPRLEWKTEYSTAADEKAKHFVPELFDPVCTLEPSLYLPLLLILTFHFIRICFFTSSNFPLVMTQFRELPRTEQAPAVRTQVRVPTAPPYTHAEKPFACGKFATIHRMSARLRLVGQYQYQCHQSSQFLYPSPLSLSFFTAFSGQKSEYP